VASVKRGEESMKIRVTREFDGTDIIGMLTLADDVEIPPDVVFALAYTVQERDGDGKPTKIVVQEVSMISDSNYAEYLKREMEAREKEE